MLWQWANNTTQVFILDLDGTLMPSAEIDDQCYWQAVFSCFERKGNAPELQHFKNVTDSGILHEWCQRELGRPPSANETENIKRVFLQLLKTNADNHPHLFQPLSGVEDWLQAVSESGQVCAGIATGGWGHSAKFKLQQSGLDRFDLPLANSDNTSIRTKIMQTAAQASIKKYSVEGAGLTYVGDGIWDLQASRLLGWSFIGIASGPQAKRLQRAGARLVIPDFCKPARNPGTGVD